jgi:hypothetical protein
VASGWTSPAYRGVWLAGFLGVAVLVAGILIVWALNRPAGPTGTPAVPGQEDAGKRRAEAAEKQRAEEEKRIRAHDEQRRLVEGLLPLVDRLEKDAPKKPKLDNELDALFAKFLKPPAPKEALHEKVLVWARRPVGPTAVHAGLPNDRRCELGTERPLSVVLILGHDDVHIADYDNKVQGFRRDTRVAVIHLPGETASGPFTIAGNDPPLVISRRVGDLSPEVGDADGAVKGWILAQERRK